MVCPGQRAPTTSRTFGVNEEPTQWSWSMGQSCASLRKKTRCWTNPVKGQYADEWAYTRTAELHLQSLPRKSVKTLRERDIGVGGPRAWLCKSCSKHRGTTTSATGGQETESKRNSSSASTNPKKDCAPRRGRTSDLLRHSGIKPMDNGNARGSRERTQRPTARRQSGEST